MKVGGDTRATKTGHAVAGVGTTEQGGSGAAESGKGVKAGGSGTLLELVSSSVIEVEEEETGVSGLGVKAGWEQPFSGAAPLATLDFKVIIVLPVINRFSVQTDIQLHLPVEVNLS